MPSLFDTAARDAILARVDRLSATTQPLWGSMNVSQMVVHCTGQLRIGLGELTAQPVKRPIPQWLLRLLVIHVGVPAPKGVPTLPEIRDPATTNWTEDRDELKKLINRFAAHSRSIPMAVHPAFGTLSNREWGLLAHIHLNHHLSQFGT